MDTSAVLNRSGLSTFDLSSRIQRRSEEIEGICGPEIRHYDDARQRLDARRTAIEREAFVDPLEMSHAALLAVKQSSETIRLRHDQIFTGPTLQLSPAPPTLKRLRSSAVAITKSPPFLPLGLELAVYAIAVALSGAGIFGPSVLLTVALLTLALAFLITVGARLTFRYKRRRLAAHATASRKREQDSVSRYNKLCDALLSDQVLRQLHTATSAARDAFVVQATPLVQEIAEQELNLALQEQAKRAAAAQREQTERASAAQAAEDESARHAREQILGTKLDTRNLSRLYEGSRHDYEVPIEQQRELTSMLSTSAPTRIGIAGPRGVGKTTLLRACYEERIGLADRHTSVLVAAPVGYDTRDFILYIFLELCQAVLSTGANDHRVGVMPEGSRPNNARRRLADRLMTLIKLMLHAATPILWISTILLTCGAFTVLILQSSDTLARRVSSIVSAAAISVALVLVAASQNQPIQLGPQAAEPIHGRAWIWSTSAVWLLPPSLMVAIFISFAIRPSISSLYLLWIAAASTLFCSAAAAGIIYHATHKRSQRVIPADPMDDASSVSDQSDWDGLDARPDMYPSGLRTEAYDIMDSLRFQLSYTTGWSGALTLGLATVGATGSRTQQSSWAQLQRTLPEIVTHFRDFLERVGRVRPVILLIDEMDKIDDHVAAVRLLNDLKALFGVQNSHVVVSISEEATTAFEQRYVNFRSEYDNAFDDVLHLDPFVFSQTAQLLRRRVVMPLPFIAMIHCLSAGLPREVLRLARRMATYAIGIGRDMQSFLWDADRQKSLESVTQFLAREYVRSCGRASWSSSAQAAPAGPHLRHLALELSAPSSSLSELTDIRNWPDIEELKADQDALRLYAAARFSATLIEFFHENQDWSRIFRTYLEHDVCPLVDFLAQSHSLIHADPDEALKRMSHFQDIQESL
jgi:hypothetical protein